MWASVMYLRGRCVGMVAAGMWRRAMGMCRWAVVLVSMRNMSAVPSAVSVDVTGCAGEGGNASAEVIGRGKKATAYDGMQRRGPVLRSASMAALDMRMRAPALGISAAHCVAVRRPTAARKDALHALLIAIKADEENVTELLFGYYLHAVPARVGCGAGAGHAPSHHTGNILLVAVKLDEQNLLQLLHVRERCLVG